MTNDFDDLVSAYIDGQATPEEVALVEGDPELRYRAETLRAIAAGMADTPPAPAALRTRHLAAALDAFDELSRSRLTSEAEIETVATTEGGPSVPVVDLAGRRRRRRSSSRAARADRSDRRAGLPNWLGAAAALLLVFGGVGWIISQSDGSDDADTAAVAIAESDGSTDSAAADDTAADESTEATQAATTDDAVAAEAELGVDEEADSNRAGDTDAAADESSAQLAPTSTTISGGFFSDEEIEEARAFYASVPGPTELDELLAGELFAPELSACAAVLDLDDNLELVGFAPISIDGEEAEVLVLVDSDDGSESVMVVDDTCTPLG